MFALFHLTTLIFLVIHEGNSEGHCNPETRYRCSSNNFCISRAKKCNGYLDCKDGEDEVDCEPGFHNIERDFMTASINGYTCRGQCRKGVPPCKAKQKSCLLDDECGFSCINKYASCKDPPPVVEHSIRYEIWKGTPDRLQRIRPGLPTLYGYVASYVCDTGRRLDGLLPRCSGTKQWSNNVPVCVDITCRSPVPILQNAISYSFNEPGRGDGIYHSNKTLPLVGYAVQYSCGENLHLVGNPPICNSDLEWTQSTIKCVVPCHAHEISPDLRCGDECDTSFDCDAGFECFCEHDCGRNCVNLAVDCGEAPLVLSSIPNYTGTGVRRIARYVCNLGFFRASGDPYLYCTGSGDWRGVAPICGVVTCGDADESIREANGYIADHGGLTYGSKIVFQCWGNYQMLGSPRRQCMGNGRWSGKLTICDEKDNQERCRHPGVPINGVIIGSDFSVDSTVRFKCYPGYVMYGPAERTCLWYKRWTGKDTPTCELPIYPHSSSDVVDALRKSLSTLPDSQTTLGRAIKADQSGKGQEIYFMFDVSASVLKNTEQLKAEVEFAKRLVKRLGGFKGYINYGIIVFASSNVTVLDIAAPEKRKNWTETVIKALTDVHSDAVGHQYERQARSGTDTALALNKLKDKISFMRQQPETEDNFRHVFIFTDGQHTEGEDPVKVRENIEKEFHKNIMFYSITACTKCAVDEQRELKGLSSNNGENFIVIDDFYQLSKYLDKVTDLEIDFKKCGQAGKVGNIDDQARLSLQRSIHGEDSNANAWPWQALITKYKKSPVEVLGNESLVGGGSIINKQWILTAAHVLDKSRKQINWEKIFVVSVGVFERPTTGDDKVKSTIEMYSIDKYVQHENYSTATYKNDIALIKLGARYDSTMQLKKSNTEGLVFSYYIRPVCLPCKGTCLTEEILLHGKVNLEGKGNAERCLAEENILLRNDAKVVATGFGHLNAYTYANVEGTRNFPYNYPKILQQVLLKIGDSQTCRKGINDINAELPFNVSYSEEINICCVSGNPNVVTDTCRGDSGGPVVREVMNTKTGEACWIQIGIVSFGYGCGQNFPSYYTNVAKFIPWIDSKILP